MHELPITQSLLEIALRHAADQHAERITDLNIVIGQLSSFIDDSVQFYWNIISAGTIAEGARLHFQRIATEMVCQTCQQRYHLTAQHLVCPNCASTDIRVVAGNEFYLDSIDIDGSKETFL